MTELMVQGQGMFASTLSGLKAAGLNEAQALAQLTT